MKSRWITVLFTAAMLPACAATRSQPSGTPSGDVGQCQPGDPSCPEGHRHAVHAGDGGASGHQHSCPMQVTGTSVVAVEEEGSAVLEFSTTGEVTELRRRVASMAAMHDRHHAGAMSSDHAHGGGGRASHAGMMGMHAGNAGAPRHGMGMKGMHAGMMGMHGEMMIPSRALAQDTERGARLVLTPDDPSRLQELRTHVLRHAERMASGHCPMMHGAHAAGGEGDPR